MAFCQNLSTPSYQLFSSMAHTDESRILQDEVTSDFGSRTTPASERCQSAQSSPEIDIYSLMQRNLSDNENGFHLQNQSGRNSASYGSLGDGGEKLSGNNSPLFADSFSPDVTTMEKSDWAVEVSPSSGIGGFADQTTEALINSIAHIRVLLPADQPSDNNSRWGEIPMEKSCWGPPPTKPAPKPPTPGEFSLWDAPAPVANELPSSGFISAPIPAGIWSFSPVEKHGSEAGEKSNQQGWGPTHSGAVGNDFASLARQIAAGMLKPNGNAPAVANNWVPPPTPDNFYGANDYRYYGTKAESQISQMKPNYRGFDKIPDDYQGGYQQPYTWDGMGCNTYNPVRTEVGPFLPPNNDYRQRHSTGNSGDTCVWTDRGFGPNYVGFVPPTSVPNNLWTCGDNICTNNPFTDYQTRMQEIYEQYKMYENDRKKIEAELARHFSGQNYHKISSSNTIWIPHLPCFPTRIDKLLNDYYRETTKVTQLLIRMRELYCHVPNEVYDCINDLSAELGLLYKYFDNVRVTRGFSAVGKVERESEAGMLAAAFKNLCERVKRVRSAFWLALTVTVKPELNASILANVATIVSRDDWWLQLKISDGRCD